MWTSRFVRFAPASGIVFFILAVLGLLITEQDSPDFVAAPEEWGAWFVAHSDSIISGSIITLTSVFFLLWFLGSLTSVLGGAEGGDRRVTSIARGGGVGGAVLLLASSAVTMVAALRVDDQKKISADLASSFGDLSAALCFIAAPYAFAALLGGTAVVALRTGVLPAWFAWISAIVALGLLVPFVSYIFLGVFAIWVLVVSVMLLLRDQVAETPNASSATTTPPATASR